MPNAQLTPAVQALLILARRGREVRAQPAGLSTGKAGG